MAPDILKSSPGLTQWIRLDQPGISVSFKSLSHSMTPSQPPWGARTHPQQLVCMRSPPPRYVVAGNKSTSLRPTKLGAHLFPKVLPANLPLCPSLWGLVSPWLPAAAPGSLAATPAGFNSPDHLSKSLGFCCCLQVQV